jgi:hypothetical protein
LDTTVRSWLLRVVSFYKNKYGIVTEQFGHIWKTYDSGDTWIYYKDDSNLQKIYAGMVDIHWLSERKIIGIFDALPCIGMFTECTTEIDLKMENKSDMIIAPNPTSDYIEIAITGNYGLKDAVKVYDVLGNVVLTLTPTLSLQGEGIKVDVSGLAAGVYFVRIGGDIYKFVKM